MVPVSVQTSPVNTLPAFSHLTPAKGNRDALCCLICPNVPLLPPNCLQKYTAVDSREAGVRKIKLITVTYGIMRDFTV
jgi:hypothetical protein